MNKNALTLTVVANMTSNYGEGLGNISSIQKIFKNRKIFAIRSRESLKNALMVQSGLYDDLKTDISGATQKQVNEKLNAGNCRALEGGYMNTTGDTFIRKSSFYLTDAISTESFVNETRFHNNLYLASNYAKANNLSVQSNAGDVGLMPYQYEYDKSLKIYSITIDLTMVGKDDNFDTEAANEEKADRVIAILDAIQHLHLTVKGNLDNAEPVFAIGGLSGQMTHVFENVIQVSEDKLFITQELKERLANGFSAALLGTGILKNESEIEKELQTVGITHFFENLKQQVKEYYK